MAWMPRRQESGTHHQGVARKTEATGESIKNIKAAQSRAAFQHIKSITPKA
jgi:hypothetical protein